MARSMTEWTVTLMPFVIVFLIAVSKEQISGRRSHDFSKAIGHEAVKAEEQAVDRLPKESIWISDCSIRFDAVLAGGWKAQGLWDGICSALREAFQYQSRLLDLGQSASE
jgi:hypothetical protein